MSSALCMFALCFQSIDFDDEYSMGADVLLAATSTSIFAVISMLFHIQDFLWSACGKLPFKCLLLLREG